jgi:hypothetical protein
MKHPRLPLRDFLSLVRERIEVRVGVFIQSNEA